MYIYCKVKIIRDGDWYKKGEVYDCAYWDNCVTPLDKDKPGYLYSYGPGMFKTIPIDDFEYIEEPDI